MKKILSLFVCMILILAVPASAATLSLKDYNNGHVNFDARNKVVGLTLNTDTDGLLYIYSGDSISKNNLIYVAYIEASDEDIVRDIKVGNIGDKYGDYKVEFYSADSAVDVVSAGFTYVSADVILTILKDAILSELKAIENPNGGVVESIITSDEDRLSMILSDADAEDYEKIEDKTAVFGKMVSGLSSIDDYDDIVELFEEAVADQYSEENVPSQTASRPSGSSSSRPNKKNDTTSVMTVGGNTAATPVLPEENIPAKEFSDMKNHWAKSYADKLQSLGIMNGYEDGSFRGENPITRAELAKALTLAYDIPTAAGASPYTDVSSADWHYKYVLAASESGLVRGYDDGSFKPNQNIVRQDAVLMLYRAMALKISMTAGTLGFTDAALISEYASEAASALAALGVIKGDEANCFNPASELSRAELAALICRSLDCIK